MNDEHEDFKPFPLGECLLTALASLAVMLVAVAVIDWVYQ